MSRISIPVRDDVPVATQRLLERVRRQFGFVPGLHRLMSISPAVLEAWLALQDALSSALDAKTRNGIALAVSEVDDCDYCRSIHNFTAGNFARVTPEEASLNREGSSGDPHRAAAVGFAHRLVETRGRLSDEDFTAVREAGFSDGEILEMVALAVQFLFTNFVNSVAQTDLDFPKAPPVGVNRQKDTAGA